MTPKPNRSLPLAKAAQIWSLYGFSTPQDLVLEDLAMAMGVFVVDAKLDSADARMVRSEDYGLVRISDRIRQRGRRRFAIAHEIGHWVLHKKVSQLLACTEQDMLVSYRSSPYEIEASSFAGALLMPEELFRAAAKERPTTRVIRALAGYFDTSLTATAIRYVETSNDYCAIVVSENNKIRWWRASDSFGNHDLWLESKSTLPRYSAAACFFRGEAVPARPIEVDLADWLGEMPGIRSDYVIEQAIPINEYDQVLSMLWLP